MCTMVNSFTFVVIICGYSCLIGATIYTKYKRVIHSQENVFSATRCGANAVGTDYCAARVTNTTCEPLTRDWCENENTSREGVHLIKTKIKTIVEATLEDGHEFRRTIPIYLGEGSELKTMFKPHNGWDKCRILLKVDSQNVALRISLVRDGSTSRDHACLNSRIYGDQSVGTEDCYIIKTFTDDTDYTIKITCDTDSFKISLDGEPEWKYEYQLPVNAVTEWLISCEGAEQDVRYVSFYTGQT